MAQAPAAAPVDLPTIVSRMEEAQQENRAHFRPYVVTRDYKLYGKEGERPTSEVTADVSFQPPDQKQYQIRQARGSGSGEKIVRRVLDKETDMARQPGEFDLCRANYDFEFLRADSLAGTRVYVLQLKPKRADKNLLKGEAWVDAESYRIRRIVGHPAKNPSWLIKDLQLTLTFGEAKGMWMQTGSDATASVRFFGRHVFTSRDVSLETVEVVAANVRPRASGPRKRARRMISASSAGAWLAR